MAVRMGYKAWAEQFDPVTLLEFAVQAERSGLEIVRAAFEKTHPWAAPALKPEQSFWDAVCAHPAEPGASRLGC